MTKTIVVTRAKGDETEFTEALHERGYRTIHEALTQIFLNHTIRAELEDEILSEPDAVIVTSRHGARALAALTHMRDSALLCVGEATAAAAFSAGFTRVYATGGNVEELATYVADAYDSNSRFLYVSAEHVRADLKELLSIYGMRVTRLVAYEAVASEALSDTLTEQLKRNQLDAVTFMSQRAAQIFSELLAKAKAEEALAKLQAITLSEAIAEPLRELPWQTIHTASEATLASLIDCVDNALNS